GLVIAIAFAAVIYAGVYGVMHGFATVQDEAAGRRRSPLATTQPVPPQPWLQPSIAQGEEPRQPWQDMQAVRLHEEASLSSDSAADKTTGATRIPIERAMQMLAAKATTQPAGQSAGQSAGQPVRGGK